MAGLSPTALSLRELRRSGYTAEVVERWNPFAHVRVDLFGFIDILAIKRGEVIGIQTTTYCNMSARRKKIMSHHNAGAVLASGIKIDVHGWRKVKNRWQCVTVSINDILTEEISK